MIRNVKKAIGIIIILCSIVLAYIILPWAGMFIEMVLMPNPQKPQITYGEFPFRLVYEIDNKTIVVEDTLICEYDGYAADTASGKYRTWKSHLRSGNAHITLFKNENLEIFYTPDVNQHAAGVYMGDTEIYSSINGAFPNAWQTYIFNERQSSAYIISADDMWEKYKLRLISWEIAPPIENNFK